MPDKLLIVLTAADPDKPVSLDAPLAQATIAAAMEYDVEVVLSGLSGKLAIGNVAESIFPRPNQAKSVHDLIRDARAAGVRFKICTTAFEQWGGDPIPEIEEIAGSAYVVSAAMDDATITLTY